MKTRPRVAVLVGPTASGKTRIGVQWAERLGLEIISADSVQVYRYMDIGTAKPSPEIRRRVPHHVIDVVDPDEGFSAARFRIEADQAIEGILSRGKRPLVVGGTGLYIRALTEGLFEGPDGDADLRSRLREEARVYGVHYLHRRLQEVDPEAACRIHPHDMVRIVRALEVYILTGVPISQHQRLHGFSSRRYHVLYLGIALDRPLLKERIHQRVEGMIQEGLVEEVRGLMERGYGPDLPSMQSIGYRHVVRYLQGLWSLPEAVEGMKRDTYRLARRQMTWFRSVKGVVWFPPHRSKQMITELGRFYESNQDSLDIVPRDCYKKRDKVESKYP